MLTYNSEIRSFKLYAKSVGLTLTRTTVTTAGEVSLRWHLQDTITLSISNCKQTCYAMDFSIYINVENVLSPQSCIRTCAAAKRWRFLNRSMLSIQNRFFCHAHVVSTIVRLCFPYYAQMVIFLKRVRNLINI